MNIKQIQEARENFGIDDWGAGYYGIDDQGKVVAFPNGEDEAAVPLPDIIAKASSHELPCPLIIRFPQIVSNQLKRLHGSFQDAIWEYNFRGHHLGVFPFKVNQRKEFIDTIVESGAHYDYGFRNW